MPTLFRSQVLNNVGLTHALPSKPSHIDPDCAVGGVDALRAALRAPLWQIADTASISGMRRIVQSYQRVKV